MAGPFWVAASFVFWYFTMDDEDEVLTTKTSMGLLWLLLLVWAIAFTGERLAWINMASYPAWLAQSFTVHQAVDTLRPDELADVADSACSTAAHHSGMKEITNKTNGLFIRCGWDVSLIPGHSSVYRIVTAD